MKYLASLALASLLAASASAQNTALQITLNKDSLPQGAITITAGKDATPQAPVVVPLSLPKEYENTTEVQVHVGGHNLPGQLTAPGITTESIPASDSNHVRRDLHFIAPAMKPGESATATLLLGLKVGDGGFRWKVVEGKHADLVLTKGPTAEVPVLRYMCEPFDDSTEANRNRTYKVFHHVFDPKTKQFITNGGYADENTAGKKLLYPHHRGIMYGFSKTTYGDPKKTTDTWHCKAGYVGHEKYLSSEAGPVLGRHRVQLGWFGDKKDRFATEEREITVYGMAQGPVIEFVSRLTPMEGTVKVDGDPQHAGFQFRANNEVSEKSAKQTYFLHPDGKGEPGVARNWDAKQPEKMADLPWYGMSFVLNDTRYTVVYMNHPRNPSPLRLSERDYGRFGGYFVAEATKAAPLVVDYRLWIQRGDVGIDEASARYAAFASPPTVSVK